MRALMLFAAAVSAPAAVHYVTVAGLGGEVDYETRFVAMAKEMEKVVAGTGGGQVHTLWGEQATRAKLRDVIAKVSSGAGEDDQFVLTLIGHGTFDGSEYKFNLKGPDVSAAELAELCNRVPARRQLVVNMTSASGGSVAALQKPGRAIVAATKSGTEKNFTVFSRYWVEALRDPSSDVDKNEVISALEAFRYADRKTTGFYEQAKRLATEHAVVEDTGKGDAVRQPGGDSGRGVLLGQFPLLKMGSLQRAAADPAKQELLKKREAIENEIDRLKLDKANMLAEEYRRKLTPLLVQLAEVQEEIDK